MLQAANTDLFNPLFPLQIKPVKVNLKLNWRISRFFTFGTNGLTWHLPF